jgi:hypothetical protein
MENSVIRTTRNKSTYELPNETVSKPIVGFNIDELQTISMIMYNQPNEKIAG